MAEPEQATVSDMEKGGEVAKAAGEAASKADNPTDARQNAETEIRRTADKVQLELSDEDAKKIAQLLVAEMEARGAFEEPPEKIESDEPQTAGEHQQEVAQVPQKKSMAERFLGD